MSYIPAAHCKINLCLLPLFKELYWSFLLYGNHTLILATYHYFSDFWNSFDCWDKRTRIWNASQMSITILGHDTLLCVREFPREHCIISPVMHQINQNRLVIVIHYYALVLCSLAPWLAVINLHLTLAGVVTKVWVHVCSASLCQYACYKVCMQESRLSVYVAHHRLFDLVVNCLGGPLIDTWDGDWILSPVSEVWQLTPSLLITSFTQAAGLLCLGPHNTTFSYWVFFHSAPSLSSSTHPAWSQ